MLYVPSAMLYLRFYVLTVEITLSQYGVDTAFLHSLNVVDWGHITMNTYEASTGPNEERIPQALRYIENRKVVGIRSILLSSRLYTVRVPAVYITYPSSKTMYQPLYLPKFAEETYV